MDFSGAVWRKSARSGQGGNDACVEVAFAPELVGVRDSKNRDGSVLAFAEPAWRSFTTALTS